MVLHEESRNSLIAQGRQGEKERTDGKSRFEKRVKSRFSTSVKEYNSIDMNSVFREGILTIGIPIRGETGDYIVRIKFGGFLEQLQQEVSRIGKVRRAKLYFLRALRGRSARIADDLSATAKAKEAE